MAHVLVIGASKGIGLETVKALLAAGHRVRASRVRPRPSPCPVRVWSVSRATR